MLIPLKDDNPLTRIRFQYVTVALIAANVAAFLWQVTLPADEARLMMYAFGMVPKVLFGEAILPAEANLIPAPLSLLTSMFLHGGWMHLIGNMLFLWVLGDNVEDSMGHGRFIVFYLATGLAAGLAHALTQPDSTIPTIGASGAISGVIGAYLVLHPKAQILTLVVRFFIRIPAFIVLGLWIGLQVMNAAIDDGTGGGVAWWAHIGGFVAGALLVIPLRRKTLPLFDGHFAGPGASDAARRPKSRPRSKPRSKSRPRLGRRRRPWE